MADKAIKFEDLIAETAKDTGKGGSNGATRFPQDLIAALGAAIVAGKGRGEAAMLAVPGHTDGFTAKTVGTAGYQLRAAVNAWLMSQDPKRDTVPDRRKDPKQVPTFGTDTDGCPIVLRQGKATDRDGFNGHVAGVWVGRQHGWTPPGSEPATFVPNTN